MNQTLCALRALSCARGWRRSCPRRSSCRALRRSSLARASRPLRRLVRQPRRHAQLPHRLLQPQHRARSSTSRSARTTTSSRATPTWASRRTSSPAAASACSSSPMPKEFAEDPEDHVDADGQRRDDHDPVPHAHRLQHHAAQVVGGEPERRVQPAAGAPVRGERSARSPGPAITRRQGDRAHGDRRHADAARSSGPTTTRCTAPAATGR